MRGFKTAPGYMTTTLDQEKFDTLKELAEMQTSLSNARAELKKLKDTTDEYLVVREQEAEARVIKVLKESRDALDEVSKNHNELSAYSNELKAYANELKDLSTGITDLFKDFNKRVKEAEKDIEKNQEIVTDILQKIKIERVQVNEDRKQLKSEQHEIDEQNRLLKDRREALERAWDELKRLQTNKENI